LRFNAANASTLALSSAGASVLGAGGLLVTGNVGNNPTIISGGTLEGAAGAELVVIQNNSANSLTISSAIANSGVSATAFTKAGPGILYLTGTNTYTGGTYVSGGTLSVSSWNVSTNGVFGNSALPVTISNGDLQYTGNSATVNRPFSIPANSQGYIEVTNSASTLALDGANLNTGSGNLIKIGPGTLRIAGPNYAQTSFTGHVIVKAGTLDFYNGGSMYGQATATPNDIQINNGAAIEFDYPSGGTIPTADGIQLSGSATINVTAATQTFNGTVANVSASATGSLTKAGAGNLTLGGVNTWTGGTTVSGGTLTLNSAVLGNVADNAYLSLATSSVAAAMPGSITISVSGAAGASYAIDQNFVNAIAATSSGEIALGVSSSNNLNFSTAGLSSAMLGALGIATTYSGVLTPANSSYRFGGVTGTLTVSSSLADSGGPTSLVLNPYGTSSVLYLTGSNTYTGGTFINGGILEAYTPISMGATSGSVNVAAGATLDLAVGGSGKWSNSNIVTLLSSSSVMFSSGAGFGLDTTGGSANYSGNVPSGNVVFTKYGPNFLMLTGSNSFTGSTIVTGGTLQLGDGATTNSPNSSSGFIINSGANLTFANPFTQAYVGNIGGAGSLTKFGASLLTLSGTAINYSGATAISGGTLVLSGGSTALLTSGITIAGGAQLTVLNGPATASYLGSGAISNSGVLSVTGGPSYAFGLSNAISGSGSLNVLGYETNLNAPLSISGDTALNAVYLVCEAANRLSPNGRLVINAGNVDMSNGNQTVAGLAGAGGGIYSFGDTGTTGLTINLASGTQIYYGNLGSNFPGFSVTKTGSGTQVFAGAVTYTGSTNVAAGSLFVNGSGTSSVTVANNATFGGSGSDGPTTVSSGGNIQAGYNSAGSLSLSSLNFAGSATLSVGNIGGSSPSILTVTGSNGLTTNGAGSIAVNVGSLAVTSTGSYEVVGYSGAIQGTGSSAFVVGTLPARVIGTLVGGNNQIQLDVTAFDYPIWTGSVTNNWDTSTSNWVLAVAGTATTFLPNDNVLFNDTAGTTTVNIPSNVSPGSVTFSNTSVSYTLTSSTGTGGITGTTGLLKTGAGLLTITNTNSFTGSVMINGGTISVGSIANSGIASPLGAGSSIVFGGGELNYTGTSASTNDTITLNAQGSTILVPAAQTLSLGGSITGTGGLAFNSAAILSLTGGLVYSGSTILSNGTLSEASYNTSGATILSGSSTLIYSGATTANATKGIAMAGPATINLSSATGVLNLTSAGFNTGFTGTGTLTKNGPGLFEIGAGGIANQYFTGKSIINGGTVEYYGQGSMYAPSVLTPAQITINNGGTASFAYPGGSALSANIGFQISGDASISSGATFPSTQNIQGVIADGSSPGNLIKTGPGVLSIGGIATYSGSTAIQNGILQIYGGPGNKLPIGTTITFGTSTTGGTLDLFGVSQQVAGLAVASGANPASQVIGNSYTGSSGTLVVNGASSSTFGGTIIDAIGNTTKKTYLTLSGGTLVLTGSNSYSGATTINGGSLIAGAAGALSHSSTVNVYNGLLDATAAPQTVAALNIYGGQLNLNAANLLTSNAYSTLGGTLNVYEATPGTAELISLPSGYTGTFTPGSLPANYSLYYGNSNQVDLVLATVSNSAAWNSSLGGSWTSGSNWLPATVPNAQAATALLGGALTASGTVTLDGSQTVGTLTFSNSTASYTLAAGNSGSLTLDNTGGTGSSQIIVWAGTHSITAPLTIANGPAFVSLINSGSLDISGNIGEAGGSHSLVLSSSDATGALSLDGSNSFSGGVYVNSGTLILNGAAALAPGSTLVIGMSSTASMPTVISSPVAAPTATLAPVPEPGTLTLFGVAALWSAIACYRFSKRPPLLEGRVA
jgi:autotransporter-associated beta strand protein